MSASQARGSRGIDELSRFLNSPTQVRITYCAHLNQVDLTRPNKPEMEGPKTAAEEMQMMRKLYNQMVLEKAQIKAEPLIQIGGIKREKKQEKEMAVAE